MRKIKVTLTINHTPLQLAKKYKKDISVINREIARGIKVEHEHTKNKVVAEKIALDHINEDLNYYKKLKE